MLRWHVWNGEGRRKEAKKAKEAMEAEKKAFKTYQNLFLAAVEKFVINGRNCFFFLFILVHSNNKIVKIS